MSLEARISEDITAIKHRLDSLRTEEQKNSKFTSPGREIDQIKSVNTLLSSLSTSLDAMELDIKAVDQGLKITNELIDKWAKILWKNQEISELLFSENGNKKWAGATSDSAIYKERMAKYQETVARYNALKSEKERQEKLAKEQEEKRVKRARERSESLQKRVYGKRSKN